MPREEVGHNEPQTNKHLQGLVKGKEAIDQTIEKYLQECNKRNRQEDARFKEIGKDPLHFYFNFNLQTG